MIKGIITSQIPEVSLASLARCISRLIVFPDRKMERKMLSLTRREELNRLVYIHQPYDSRQIDRSAEHQGQLHLRRSVINTHSDPCCLFSLQTLTSFLNRCFNLIFLQGGGNVSKFKAKQSDVAFSLLISTNPEFWILFYLRSLSLFSQKRN